MSGGPGIVRGVRGWSNAARARYGAPPASADEPCYYCGVVDCVECGEPPALLRDLGAGVGGDREHIGEAAAD